MKTIYLDGEYLGTFEDLVAWHLYTQLTELKHPSMIVETTTGEVILSNIYQDRLYETIASFEC